MKTIIPFLLLVIFTLNTCKENEPTAPKEETPSENVLEASIGSEGGELRTDDFILTIPSGTFSSTSDLKLSVETEEKPYSENAVSNLYRIDGLPSDFHKPLRMAVKYQGTLSNESFIAIGEEVAVKSLGDTTTTYCLFETSDSAGFLVTSIGIPESFNKTVSLHKSHDEVKDWIKIVGISNLHLVQSTEKHFMIIGEASKTSKIQLESVGSDCETAYNVFINKGFSYDNRESWPIPIFVKEIKDESGFIYGYYTKSKFLNSYGYIVLNTGLFSEPDELLVTVGHEFFHLVQDLYDPRDWGTKMYNFGNYLWLYEATAVYSEEFFINNPGEYVSSAFEPCIIEPFYGFHKEGKVAGEHGYGMASVIKYLRNRFLSSELINIFSDISFGKHPIETIIFNSNETTDWVAPFFREYLEGKIYDVQPSFWVNYELDDKYIFNIDSKDDTLKVFSHFIPNLGAWIYKALLNYPTISQSSSIDFILYGNTFDDAEISVYKYNNNELIFLNNSTTQVTVPDIKELTSHGWNLLGLLTNSNDYPYTGTMPFVLNIKRSEKPKVTGCLIEVGSIEADVLMDYADGSTTTEDGWYSDEFFSHTDEPTTITIFENNEYISSFDYTASDGIIYSGTASVKFDEEFKNILSFSVSRRMEYEPTKYYGYIKESSVSGHDIPIDPYNANNIWFRTKGIETCDKIDNMSYQWITTGYTETKEIKNCNEDSKIEILVGIK